MSEERNIEEGNVTRQTTDKKAGSQQSTPDSYRDESPQPASANQPVSDPQDSANNLQSETIPQPEHEPQPQTTNMETHAQHLHKAPGGGWSHYLFEFLMLFLAVFCGFLAENQREHLVEHDREKKYMEMLYEDLKKDTADYANDTIWWKGAIRRMDTIMMEIEKPENERNLFLLYRKAGGMRSYNSFQYHDRVMQQLKSAGNFRLIRSKSIADSLNDYDALIATGLKDLEAQSNVIYQQVNFLQDKIFNSTFFHLISNTLVQQLDSVYRRHPEVFSLSSAPHSDLLQYFNHLEFYRRTCGYRVTFMSLLCRQATELIEALKQQYHLK